MLNTARAFVRQRFPHLAMAVGALRKYPLESRLPVALQPLRHLRNFHFDIVHGCQLRCVGCPNSTLEPKIQRIALGDFERCLRHVDVRSVDRFALFNYGEPLLHDDLPGILDIVRRRPWAARRIEISTNAQRVDWVQLAAAIRLRVLTHFAISCDGDGTPADFERLRPPAKWSRLVEFFARLAELRDRHDPALQIFTRTIATTPEARTRWLTTLTPFGITPEFRGWLQLPQARENPSGRSFKPGVGHCSFQERSDQLYVDATGDVVPCCAHPGAAFLGNLLQSTFSEIQRGAVRRKFRHQLAHDRAQLAVCARCEFGRDQPLAAPSPVPFAFLRRR